MSVITSPALFLLCFDYPICLKSLFPLFHFVYVCFYLRLSESLIGIIVWFCLFLFCFVCPLSHFMFFLVGKFDPFTFKVISDKDLLPCVLFCLFYRSIFLCLFCCLFLCVLMSSGISMLWLFIMFLCVAIIGFSLWSPWVLNKISYFKLITT